MKSTIVCIDNINNIVYMSVNTNNGIFLFEIDKPIHDSYIDFMSFPSITVTLPKIITYYDYSIKSLSKRNEDLQNRFLKECNLICDHIFFGTKEECYEIIKNRFKNK